MLLIRITILLSLVDMKGYIDHREITPLQLNEMSTRHLHRGYAKNFSPIKLSSLSIF